MQELCRIQVDKFELKNSLSFEDLENNKECIDKYLIKMEDIFKDFPKLSLSQKKKDLLLNGVKLSGYESYKDDIYNIYIDNFYIGLRTIKNGILKRDIII